MTKKWDADLVREESKKFSTPRQFSISKRAAYLFARENGMLDELYPRPVMTLEEAKVVASRYARINDFRAAHNSLHRLCRKNGWMDEIAKTMGQAMGPNGRRIKWTVEALQRVATQYSSFNALEESLPGAWKAVNRNDWFNEVAPFFKLKEADKPQAISEEYVMSAARRYSTKVAFKTSEGEAYDYAVRNNLLDMACAHMVTRWCEESVRAEAKKYKARTEFSKQSRGAYMFAFKKGLLDSICAHMVSKKMTLAQKADVEAIKAAARSCSSRTEFKTKFSVYRLMAIELGIYEEVCIPIAQGRIQKIKEAALSCETRLEFRRKYGSFAKKAVELGIFDEICSHMKKRYS